MVVESERPDLMLDHREASQITFEKIKSLKDIETALLKRLAKSQPGELLEDDSLLQQLKESRQTAEEIATNLRKVNSTN